MKTLKSSILYYVLRVLQRLALLATGLLTVIFWIVLLQISIGGTFAREQVGHEWRNAAELQQAVAATINHLSWNVAVAAFVSIVLCLVLFALPRVRRFEKRLVIDGLVIAVFCLLSVMLSQFLVADFIESNLIQYDIAD